MCGLAKLDEMRTDRIRGTTKVGSIANNVQERRLKCSMHVMRRDEHCVGRSATGTKVQGRFRFRFRFRIVYSTLFAK